MVAMLASNSWIVGSDLLVESIGVGLSIGDWLLLGLPADVVGFILTLELLECLSLSTRVSGLSGLSVDL